MRLQLLFAVGLARAAVLCPSKDHGGSFLALVSDGVFNVNAPKDGGPERWKLVNGASTSPEKLVANSFTGTYMQVLPDDGDDYGHVYGEESFVWTSLEATIRVETAGAYSLFVRWSGGDTIGGGDSFYVVIDRGGFVRGSPTWREKKVGINDVPGQFAGCCYSMTTHACPCSTEACTEAEGYWIAAADAGNRGVTCDAGPGDMESLSPLWYEFAGQAYGNVMDFDSEPWDATCEAEGSGTKDSGHDEATWDLEKGEYALKFYPREDGTAIDAIYLAPFGAPPPTGLRLAEGDSSTCSSKSSSSSSSSSSSLPSAFAVFLIFFVIAVLLFAAAFAIPGIRSGLADRWHGAWQGRARGGGEVDEPVHYVHMARTTTDFSAPTKDVLLTARGDEASATVV